METIGYFLIDLWNQIKLQVQTIRIWDVLDIVIVAFLFYKCLQFIRETRAVQLLKGIIILLVLMQLSDMLEMYTTNMILKNTMQLGLMALLILFQPELRSALEQMGRSKLGKVALFRGDELRGPQSDSKQVISAVCAACEYLSRNKIGALLVFERGTRLGDIIKTGTILDADASGELIVSIFFPNNPLHDGATVVREGKLFAAGCFLPLTQNPDLSKELGTRHRAAIGVTECSDALVIIVSEETGTISSARDGKIQRDYTVESLRALLTSELLPQENKREGKAKWWKSKTN